MINRHLRVPDRLPDTTVEYVGGEEIVIPGGCERCSAVQVIRRGVQMFTWVALVWHASACPELAHAKRVADIPA